MCGMQAFCSMFTCLYLVDARHRIQCGWLFIRFAFHVSVSCFFLVFRWRRLVILFVHFCSYLVISSGCRKRPVFSWMASRDFCENNHRTCRREQNDCQISCWSKTKSLWHVRALVETSSCRFFIKTCHSRTLDVFLLTKTDVIWWSAASADIGCPAYPCLWLPCVDRLLHPVGG